MDFLDVVLPTKGFYCAARLIPTGGFAHRFFDNIIDLKAHLAAADAQGSAMYVAQATYAQIALDNHAYNSTLPYGSPKEARKRTRTKQNAVYLRNFFVDIDCGAEKFAKDPDKSYPSQGEAAQALITFCQASGLPLPYLVHSGNGLYAHWAMSEDVPAERWAHLAHILKDVLRAYGFRQDPSRTSDSASVLRPVGTHNRKDPANPKSVRLLKMESQPLQLTQWVALLDRAARQAKVETKVFDRPTTFRGGDNEWTSGLEGPESSLEKIATRCAQVRRVRDLKGDVSEPTWYNFIGLAQFTLEAKETADGIIHDWSEGHPDYSADVTAGKIEHHRGSGAGPTTCAKFGADSPTECVACPHKNKVKSPIVLGRPGAVSIAATEEEEDDLPWNFQRTAEGLFFIEEKDTEPVRFYPYDLSLVKIAYDYTLRHETVTIRHAIPHKGYQEFSVGSHLLHDPKALLMELAKNHVQVSGKESKGLMAHYIDAYMAQLRKKRQMSTLYSQMGWHEDEGGKVFVLGEKVIKPDGESVTGFAANIPLVAKAFSQQGELHEWVRATQVFDLPGMEPLAFAFLAGAFGAPLLRFTGFAGAMVALVGPSGLGKTLVGEWVLSTYGDPQKLRLLKKDTTNMIFSRLGLYGSLPVYMDEISNIDPKELSDLLYGITQGREKGRLHRSGQERASINEWNTIALASSNHSLNDKLSGLKTDATAELNRVVEVKVNPVAGFDRATATGAYRAFYENFGCAGPVFAEWLVQNQEKHQANLDKLSADLDRRTGARSDERFWSAVAACAIYGGLVARKLGLIAFDVERIVTWLVDSTSDRREEREDLVGDQVSLLGQMLDDLAGGALIIAKADSGVANMIKEPKGAVNYRIETDTNRLFIPRNVVKRYLDKHYGSYSGLRDELKDRGALLQDGARKVLGAGTFIGGTQQLCWVIDLAVPVLGRHAVGLVRATTIKEAV